MPELKWIKLYTKMFDDEKIQVIEQMSDGEAIINIWVKLLCLAGKTNAGGYIFLSENIPYNEATLAAVLHKPALTVKQTLSTLQELGMIAIDQNGIYLTHWETYQVLDSLEHRRELQRERTEKFRKKQRLSQGNDIALQNQKPFLKCNAKTLQVTIGQKAETELATKLLPCNANPLPVTLCNAVDIEGEEEVDIDKDNITILKDSGNPLSNIAAEIKKLPGWKNNGHDDEWFTELVKEFPCISLSAIKSCRDWHLTKHPKAKHVWKTALRNWLINEEKFATERQQNGRVRENPANKSAGVFAKLSQQGES